MKLLIIADDFTGAMDTAVQFSDWQVSTLVTTTLVSDADIVVVDTDTRHANAQDAYQKVYDLVCMAKSQGFTHFYKKVDSTLRGNIGAEIAALMDATGYEEISLLPAYPENGRTTVGGIQYVDGVPLDQSPSAQDPFDPIRTANVMDIVRSQCTRDGIIVYDAKTDEDLLRLAHTLNLHIIAGCAGLAKHLPQVFDLEKASKKRPIIFPEEFVVISGSVHPKTLEQLQYAKEHGFVLHSPTETQNINSCYIGPTYNNRIMIAAASQKENLIVSESEQTRQRIASALAKIAVDYAHQNKTLIIFGGDTFREVVNQLNCHKIKPLREVLPGIVLSQSLDGNYTFVSKSGGFGSKDVLLQIEKSLRDINR